MNDLIQIFIDHLLFDKEFVQELMPRLHKEFELIGGFLKKHSETLYCTDKEELSELFDFLDGNGFMVERPENPSPWDKHPIKLIPIYTEETENEEEKESINCVYISVPTTPLYYTSVEAGTRYILELPQFLPPRPLRLRIRGRMEFLRLVPKSRCRGSSLSSRPP